MVRFLSLQPLHNDLNILISVFSGSMIQQSFAKIPKSLPSTQLSKSTSLVKVISYCCYDIRFLVSVVSDSVGKRFLSGFGGQVDFIRGASIGDDGLGRPIIALPSISKKGHSKIVPYIKEVMFSPIRSLQEDFFYFSIFSSNSSF